MTFTCNIQKVDFFIDQIEEKGQVNLDQAIDIFQNFPFDDQLKEASKRELMSSLPTVTFKSEDGSTLSIWAENDKGFSFHYDNGKQCSNFYLSNNFEENPQGIAAEEFIELFFKKTIEQELDLIEIEEENNEDEDEIPETHKKASKSNIVTFSFSDTVKYKLYLWTLPWLGLALLLFKVDAEHNFEMGWGAHLLFAFFWLPSTIIHLSYWLRNNGAVVSINTSTKTITYEKDGQQIKFTRNDIHHCEINETRSYNAAWINYRYIWFVLKDKRQVVITNFITEPENIIDALKPHFKVDKRTIPFLPI
jgi:hypothetical protein